MRPRRIDHTFQIFLAEEIQSPSVQKWLREHFYQRKQQPDSILTNVYRNESGYTHTVVTFPPVQIERLEGEEAKAILTTQFRHTEPQAQAFLEEYGQLLHYVLSDRTHIYHMRPLCEFWAEIVIEFPV